MKFSYSEQQFGRLKNAWGWLVGLGLIMVIAACLGITSQTVATFLTIQVLAFFMFAAGVFQMVQAYHAKRSTIRWYALFFGFIYMIAALGIIKYPFAAASALTLLLASAFFIIGAVRVYYAWRIYPNRGWGIITFSGIVSLLLGILIMSAWPSSSFWTIGLLLSIDLLFTGITFISLGMTFKNMS